MEVLVHVLFMACLVPRANSPVCAENITNSGSTRSETQSLSDLFVSRLDCLRRITSDDEGAMDTVFEGRDPIFHLVTQVLFCVGVLPKREARVFGQVSDTKLQTKLAVSGLPESRI